jgi:hypothetical protein
MNGFAAAQSGRSSRYGKRAPSSRMMSVAT